MRQRTSKYTVSLGQFYGYRRPKRVGSYPWDSQSNNYQRDVSVKGVEELVRSLCGSCKPPGSAMSSTCKSGYYLFLPISFQKFCGKSPRLFTFSSLLILDPSLPTPKTTTCPDMELLMKV